MKTQPCTLALLLALLLNHSLQTQDWNSKPLFDMRAMLDESTLKIDVLQDWHEVNGPVPMRQKLISIEVSQLVPGQPYRVPVRMIVPATGKAKAKHRTGCAAAWRRPRLAARWGRPGADHRAGPAAVGAG